MKQCESVWSWILLQCGKTKYMSELTRVQSVLPNKAYVTSNYIVLSTLSGMGAMATAIFKLVLTQSPFYYHNTIKMFLCLMLCCVD